MTLEPEWWLAATIAERARGRPNRPTPGGEGFDALRSLEDTVLGEGSHAMTYRALGLSAGLIAGMLEESHDDLVVRLPTPEWALALRRRFYRDDRGHLPAAIAPLFESNNWQRTAALLAWPLVADARDAIEAILHSTLDRREVPHDRELVRASLENVVVIRLGNHAIRTVVSEAHNAGLAIEAFTHTLRDRDAAWALLREYPVLARDLLRLYDDTLDMIEEFLGRLSQDWPGLSQGSPRARLTRISGTGSDPHNAGREVFELDCEVRKWMYKPRPCIADSVLLDHLLPFIAPGETAPPVEFLLRDNYAWMSFVEHAACQSSEQLGAFFHHAGRMTAAAHFLGLTDLHCDNVIANASVPVIIDGDALIHPLNLVQVNAGNRADSSFSLFDTMLLPGAKRELAADMGGWSKVDRRASAPVPIWERETDGNPRVVFKPMVLAARPNLPFVTGGEQALPECYHAQMRSGLAQGYEELAQGGFVEALLAAAGDAPTRVVLRPTVVYMHLLADLRHPSLLQDGLQRDCWLMQLGAFEADVPLLMTALPWEWQALSRGDVPVFWTRGGAQDIYTHGAKERVAVLPVSGREQVRERLRNPTALAQLEWQVSCGLALGCGLSLPQADAPVAESVATASDPVAKAREIADYLVQLAVPTDRGGLDWMTVKRDVDDDQWGLHVLGEDVYDGLSGIALFLLYLGDACGSQAYIDSGNQALWQAYWRWRELPERIPGGGYCGTGSLVYAMMHAHALGIPWASEALDELVEHLVTSGATREEPQHDVLYGDAGLLLVLLRLIMSWRRAQAAGDSRVVALAIDLASGLRDAAVHEHGEAFWRPGSTFGDTPLSGMSHGSAGIAYALAEATRVLEAPDLEGLGELVAAAHRHENHEFDEAEGTWLNSISPDADAVVDAPIEAPVRNLCSWCNGAPGIGLARAMISGGGEPWAEAAAYDVTRALDAIERGLSGLSSDCLCHGIAGTLEAAMILQAASDAPTSQWIDDALTELGERVPTSYRCSNPLGIPTPELMTGLAGIGMFWLRLAARRPTPCLMTLEGPC